MSTPDGSICHLEMYAVSLSDSARLYAELFDWEMTPHDLGYMFWKDPSGMSGAFTTAGAPVTNPAATFYIKVSNIPEMLKKLIQKGCTVIRERTEIGGDNGYYALFRDLAGNNVGLWCGKKTG